MRNTAIGTESVLIERPHPVHKLYSFLDIPGDRPGNCLFLSTLFTKKAFKSARAKFEAPREPLRFRASSTRGRHE